MGYPMEPNQALLSRLMGDVEKHFGAYLKEILEASADYGSFGLPLLDALHDELPGRFATTAADVVTRSRFSRSNITA